MYVCLYVVSKRKYVFSTKERYTFSFRTGYLNKQPLYVVGSEYSVYTDMYVCTDVYAVLVNEKFCWLYEWSDVGLLFVLCCCC